MEISLKKNKDAYSRCAKNTFTRKCSPSDRTLKHVLGYKPDEHAKWLEWAAITSIPLRELAPDGSLIGVASGCLVNFHERRFLITVSHAVKINSTDWVIEIGYDPEKGTEVYKPVCFLYLGEMVRGTRKFNDIDYVYAEVASDLQPTFQLLSPDGPLSEKRDRHVFNVSDIAEPKKDRIYAFSGQIRPEQHGSNAYALETVVYPGLRYTGSDGPFHQFTLPVEHPGHDSFKGCSGAPIIDAQGRLIALLSCGDIKKNAVYGVSTSRYLTALESYCRVIAPA